MEDNGLVHSTPPPDERDESYLLPKRPEETGVEHKQRICRILSEAKRGDVFKAVMDTLECEIRTHLETFYSGESPEKLHEASIKAAGLRHFKAALEADANVWDEYVKRRESAEEGLEQAIARDQRMLPRDRARRAAVLPTRRI